MKKVLSCILSFVPLVMYVALILLTIPVAIFAGAEVQGTEIVVLVAVIFVVVLSILFTVSTFGVMIYFIVLTVRSQNLDSSMKIMWCVLLYFLNVYFFPVYWFVYIRRDIV